MATTSRGQGCMPYSTTSRTFRLPDPPVMGRTPSVSLKDASFPHHIPSRKENDEDRPTAPGESRRQVGDGCWFADRDGPLRRRLRRRQQLDRQRDRGYV